MNWEPFKCSLCCHCLCGALLAPLTLKREVVGSNTTFLQIFILNSVEFYGISLGKPRLFCLSKDTHLLPVLRPNHWRI